MQLTNSMIIRNANTNDLEHIMFMYKSCVKGMLENNIDQWDNTYPNSEIILNDIKAKTYFIAEVNGKIIGGVNIDENQDQTYLTINWKDKSNHFLVVHRLAVKKENWGDKIGKGLMQFAEELASEKNYNSIRLDTYSSNLKAIEFYKRLGYTKLGAINLKPNKKKYYCFEKII